jgi:hypothetical protein
MTGALLAFGLGTIYLWTQVMVQLMLPLLLLCKESNDSFKRTNKIFNQLFRKKYDFILF